MSSTGSGLRDLTPPRSAVVPMALPHTPPSKTRQRFSTPGRRQAVQQETGLEGALRRHPQNFQVVERILRSDPSEAVLPFDGGKPVLIVAMKRRCSAAVLRLLINYGAQVDQLDSEGRNAIDALVAMSVPDAVTLFGDAPRPCPTVSRLHVQYAIVLLNHGARTSRDGQVGAGNAMCATCARMYGDALIAEIMMKPQTDESLCPVFVAEFDMDAIHATKVRSFSAGIC